MIAYVLNKDISGEKILQDISGLIEKFREHSQDEIPILCIHIKTISREDTTMIPKLEHKILDSNCIT